MLRQITLQALLVPLLSLPVLAQVEAPFAAGDSKPVADATNVCSRLPMEAYDIFVRQNRSQLDELLQYKNQVTVEVNHHSNKTFTVERDYDRENGGVSYIDFHNPFNKFLAPYLYISAEQAISQDMTLVSTSLKALDDKERNPADFSPANYDVKALSGTDADPVFKFEVSGRNPIKGMFESAQIEIDKSTCLPVRIFGHPYLTPGEKVFVTGAYLEMKFGRIPHVEKNMFLITNYSADIDTHFGSFAVQSSWTDYKDLKLKSSSY